MTSSPSHKLALIAVLTGLAMLAFAANSILTRMALSGDAIGPAAFAALRALSAAIMLMVLLRWRDGAALCPEMPHFGAIIGLGVYLGAFSFAYMAMDAGLGAFLLFGVVQLAMFAAALVEGDRPSMRQWLGMGIAFCGLAVLVLPGSTLSASYANVVMMVAAGLGWGWYSLAGRAARDPLAATGWNFVYVTPLVLCLWLVMPSDVTVTVEGAILAMISGAITSALGYTIWYSIMPALGASRGAMMQLSVPVLALALGALFLAETVSTVSLLAASLILFGLALGLMRSRRIGLVSECVQISSNCYSQIIDYYIIFGCGGE